MFNEQQPYAVKRFQHTSMVPGGTFFVILVWSHSYHMMNMQNEEIIRQYNDFISERDFPCVAARAAIAKQQVSCLVADHLACPKDDHEIITFLYNFVDKYRNSGEIFHSAAVIFTGPVEIEEPMFDRLLWQRLQALSDIDAQHYAHDQRVSSNPASAAYSFSIKAEAFFIIGLHPGSSRKARRFAYPVLAFNPHAQFEQLREKETYAKMQNIVRKRDLAFSGSINPMLRDFGEASEVYQYSGQVYDTSWTCPLNHKNEPTRDHSAT